jgi:hypothetical protein
MEIFLNFDELVHNSPKTGPFIHGQACRTIAEGGTRLKIGVTLFFILIYFDLYGQAFTQEADKSISRRMFLEPQSKLSFTGETTLHSFEVHAKKMVLSAKVRVDRTSKDVIEQALMKNQMREFELEIPVHELRSESSGLNDRMYDVLNSGHYPLIRFSLKNYQTQLTDINGKQFAVNARGRLRVAGVEKEIEVMGRLEVFADHLRLTGSKELLMSQFGIEPPSILFINTDDRVVVSFDFILKIL